MLSWAPLYLEGGFVASLDPFFSQHSDTEQEGDHDINTTHSEPLGSGSLEKEGGEPTFPCTG